MCTGGAELNRALKSHVFFFSISNSVSFPIASEVFLYADFVQISILYATHLRVSFERSCTHFGRFVIRTECIGSDRIDHRNIFLVQRRAVVILNLGHESYRARI